MRKITTAVALATALLASGCATYQTGSASQSTLLKRFEPVPGMGSVYVCRIPALLSARGVKTEVLIDNENIGTLKANSFVHTTVGPGKHGVLLRHDGINWGAGGFDTFEIGAGEIQFLWVGVTGKGWGVLTVDRFDTEAEARECVLGAEYSVPGA